MTPEQVQSLVRRYIAHQQARVAVALTRLYSEDATIESPSVGAHTGRDAIEGGYRQWFASFPDFDFVPEGTVTDGSAVSLAFHAAGTHRDEFLGLPATGKRVEFRGVYLQQLRDDHIVHERRIYDFTGFLIKLGVLRVKPA